MVGTTWQARPGAARAGSSLIVYNWGTWGDETTGGLLLRLRSRGRRRGVARRKATTTTSTAEGGQQIGGGVCSLPPSIPYSHLLLLLLWAAAWAVVVCGCGCGRKTTTSTCPPAQRAVADGRLYAGPTHPPANHVPIVLLRTPAYAMPPHPLRIYYVDDEWGFGLGVTVFRSCCCCRCIWLISRKIISSSFGSSGSITVRIDIACLFFPSSPEHKQRPAY